MEENELIQAASIRALAHLAETRDPETGNHILRTQGYVRLLAIKLRDHPRFAETLNDGYIKMLADSAPLHDIGKVGIPGFDPAEAGQADRRGMGNHEDPFPPRQRRHRAGRARHGAPGGVSRPGQGSRPLASRALGRRGYPDGLDRGGDSDFRAADDHRRRLRCPDFKRVYKEAMPIDKVREIIASERGKQFDPDVTDIFLASFSEFSTIAEQHSDG
jgi:putative two-component system response regulator